MNIQEFKIGDKVKFCDKTCIINNEFALIYTVANTKKCCMYGNWYQKIQFVGYKNIWYKSNNYINIGESNMTAKKCSNCTCNTENPPVNYVEIVKERLKQAIEYEAKENEISPDEVFDDSYNHLTVSYLIEILEDFGYDIELKTLGFEIILVKK